MDITGSSDAKGVVLSKLEQGLEGDNDIHGKDKTTRRLGWSVDFAKDVRRLSARKDTWSQTENEMVLGNLAIEESNEVMKETPLGWIHPMSNFRFVTKIQTSSRSSLNRRFKSAVSSISSVDLGTTEEDDYRIAILKEDARKLNKYESDYGMETRDRLIIGLSRLIINNKQAFSRGTIEHANIVKNNVESQLDSIESDAIYNMKEFGRLIRQAKEDGEVYEDELEEEIKFCSREYSDAYELFKQGYN